MRFKTLLIAAAACICSQAQASYHYVGGDISLLPEYENAGAHYNDHEGKPVADVLSFLHNEGMNAMRVRLFVNPKDYPSNDPNACQDLDYIIPLCKRIKDTGFDLMLDFHYSDTWADPAKQWTPKAWENLSDEQLYQKIYDYTKETLATLKQNGVTPDFIQPGNEISYGMLWGKEGSSNLKKTFMGSDANWERLGKLLNRAIKACREECPEAKIVIHTERVAQPDVQKNFYEQMDKLSVDYDIIGLSYYPYFHGNLNVLKKAIDSLITYFPLKNIMLVETGYSYAWPVTENPVSQDYPLSDEGQNRFAQELVALLESYEKVDGLFWWWMEYNAHGTNLSGWYNAPLFDSRTGNATSALKTICSFADGNDSAVDGIYDDNTDAPEEYYNLQGIKVTNPENGIFIVRQGKKVSKRVIR